MSMQGMFRICIRASLEFQTKTILISARTSTRIMPCLSGSENSRNIYMYISLQSAALGLENFGTKPEVDQLDCAAGKG